MPLIKGDGWIDNKIRLIIEAVNAMDLGNPFLYEGGKYFHKLYDCKEREYCASSFGLYDDVFSDVFGTNRITYFKKKGFIPFSCYLGDYLFFKFEKKEEFSDKWEKPFDYLIDKKHIVENPDEGFVCCWVSIIIEETIAYSKKYLNYSNEGYMPADTFPETYEDRYFQILSNLFFFDKKPEKLE